MRSSLPLTLYCISLMMMVMMVIFLQQTAALPVGERRSMSRLELINKLMDPREDTTSATNSQTETFRVSSSASSRYPEWLANFLKLRPASGARAAPSPSLSWARPAESSQRAPPRARRHAHSRTGATHHYPHHAQLMRVGCVLGTCQVQNLSHRLYQLIGQSGRQDSSPINPKSPHSYG